MGNIEKKMEELCIQIKKKKKVTLKVAYNW